LNLLENKAEREALKAALDTYRVRIGLSDLVKLCLYLADKPMTPVEIRNFILNFGSESSTQPNLLQSVHTILTRLKGEVVKEEINDDGDKAFRLLTIAERIVKTGVDASAANKAGKEVENKFDLKGSGWYQNMMDTLDATVIVTNPDGEPSLVVRPKQAYGNAGLRAKLKDIKRDR
jgi:hypothetical protein